MEFAQLWRLTRTKKYSARNYHFMNWCVQHLVKWKSKVCWLRSILKWRKWQNKKSTADLRTPATSAKRLCRWHLPFTCTTADDSGSGASGDFQVELVEEPLEEERTGKTKYQSKKGKWLAVIFGDIPHVLRYDGLRAAVRNGRKEKGSELKECSEIIEKKPISKLREILLQISNGAKSKRLHAQRKVAEQLLSSWKWTTTHTDMGTERHNCTNTPPFFNISQILYDLEEFRQGEVQVPAQPATIPQFYLN